MNVLIVSAVFPPEPVVSARLSHDLQMALSDLGHEVQVLCPLPSRGVVQNAASFGMATEAGVVRLDSYRNPRSEVFGRTRESWDFGRKAANWIRNYSNGAWDVIYANVWPLFGQFQIVKAAEYRAMPVVLHVQDVYPESLVTKLPKWLYLLAAPALTTLDRASVHRCAAVVLLSNRISQKYAEGRRIQDLVRVVRNWVDDTPFIATHDRKAVCTEYDIPADRFTFMYLGNLSALSALDDAIRAFAKFGDAESQFVIVGEGSAKADCQRLVKDAGLANVFFRTDLDPAKVPRIQTMADVFILPTKKGGSMSSTPSKCISYMLSAKPIIAAVDAKSDVADDLRSADCAWICSPEDIGQMADAMQAAKSCSDETRARMVRQARAFGMAQFSREKCLGQMCSIIEGVGLNNNEEH